MRKLDRDRSRQRQPVVFSFAILFFFTRKFSVALLSVQRKRKKCSDVVVGWNAKKIAGVTWSFVLPKQEPGLTRGSAKEREVYETDTQISSGCVGVSRRAARINRLRPDGKSFCRRHQSRASGGQAFCNTRSPRRGQVAGGDGVRQQQCPKVSRAIPGRLPYWTSRRVQP